MRVEQELVSRDFFVFEWRWVAFRGWRYAVALRINVDVCAASTRWMMDCAWSRTLHVTTEGRVSCAKFSIMPCKDQLEFSSLFWINLCKQSDEVGVDETVASIGGPIHL